MIEKDTYPQDPSLEKAQNQRPEPVLFTIEDLDLPEEELKALIQEKLDYFEALLREKIEYGDILMGSYGPEYIDQWIKDNAFIAVQADFQFAKDLKNPQEPEDPDAWLDELS